MILNNIDPIDIILGLPAVFLAMSFHEFAHAFIAVKMGDPTPKYQGRLTLDPLAHVDWIGFIMFAIFNFGWAKPVQINPSNFRNKKLGSILVSLAGPLGNLILAIIFFIIQLTLLLVFKVNIISLIFPHATGSMNPQTILFSIISKIVILNIAFAILNLVPIPPFDGYHIIKDLFYKKNLKFFWYYEKYSLFILLGFILLNLFDYIVGIPVSYIYSWLIQIAFFING